MNRLIALAVRVVLVGVLAQAVPALADSDPIRVLVDRHLQPVSGVATDRCTDAEFLRRVSLDLIGMPPTAEEARLFIADTAADKRERLVDQLLASPHHVRHLATTLDLMLMERRANKNVTADEWQAWLLQAVKENRPWNIMARQILAADGEDPTSRPAARFALDRTSEANLITKDIGRIFFGKDLQCAQCHDHPLVNDYLQSDYHGLLAYVAPGYALEYKQGDKKLTLHAERAGSDLSFESVFVEGTRHRTGPRMPDDTAIDEPFFLPGDEYEVAPATNVKSVPKFSRRNHLAERSTNGANQAFNENIVNRLWAHMFGRGLVHPLDLHHPDNPAIDPELLQAMGVRFAETNFDMRAFLREIALTNVYQRAFDTPTSPAAHAARALEQVVQLEQQLTALKEAADASSKAYTDALEAWHESESILIPAAKELDAARTAYSTARTNRDKAASELSSATTAHQQKLTAATNAQAAVDSIQQAVQALPGDKPLSDIATNLAAQSQRVTNEVAALAKTVEQKTAALKAPADALAAAEPPVDSGLAKTTPLKAAMMQAEKAMLQARRKAAIDAQAVASLELRLETTRALARLPALEQAIEVATAAVTAQDAQLKAVQQQVAESQSAVDNCQKAVTTATDAMTQMSGTVSRARAEHQNRSELVTALKSALVATEVAVQKAPEDAVLTGVVASLKERSGSALDQSRESQTVLDNALAAEELAKAAIGSAEKKFAEASAELQRQQTIMTETTEALATARSGFETCHSDLNAALAELDDRWTNDFTVAPLKPLTPEQLCWSVFQVTGVYERYWQAEEAELDKSKPLTDEQKQDGAQLAARSIELEQRTYDKLKSNIGTFVKLYGAGAGQPQGDFFSTADQALFAANSGSINGWIAPTSNNVTDRIIRNTDSRLAAEELYLGVLTRMPTEDEVSTVTSFLASREADRKVAAQELVWGLLNSAEFRFNH